MADTFSVVIITGSPVHPSRTEGLAQLVGRRLSSEGMRVRMLHVRDLPAEALLHAKFADPKIKEANEWVAEADGVIVVSPVYKAAYTGAFKAFIDLLPQFGLRDKVVLPLLVGGTLAHVLAIDYAIRPMLQSLDPLVIVSGLFLLDRTIEIAEEGVRLAPDLAARLDQIVQAFIDGLNARRALVDRPAATDADFMSTWPM
jgi:FMN reductase